MQRHRLPAMTASMSWSLGVGKSFEQRRCLHDLAGLAISALRHLRSIQAFCSGCWPLRVEPFDRRDLGAGDVAERA